jgi:hypothetical protein
MNTARGAETVHKVAGFVTRGAGPARDLLVFRHPAGGIRLPAGTVEQGEDIRAAVAREVAEETGLAVATLVRHLESLAESWPPEGRTLTRATPLFAEPAPAAPTLPIPLGPGLTVPRAGRGFPCRLLQDNGKAILEAGYVRVAIDVFDFSEREWRIVESVVGWLPGDTLTADVRRHLFHLEAAAPTPDRWHHDGDVPGCELMWRRLDGDLGLVGHQAGWLHRVLPQLRSGDAR